MADETIGLNEHRANKKEDNTLWSSLECAEAFVRDIKNGRLKPVRLILVYEEELPSGNTAIAAYRANVKRDTEISMIWAYLHIITTKWLIDDN